MLRSRSYNAAVRLLQEHPKGVPDPYFSNNKFTSVTPIVEGDIKQPETENNKGKGVTAIGTEQHAWPSQLHTLAIKDNIATIDLPTTCASSTLKSHTSPFEATVVRQLRAVGVNVVGKTNLDEFGMGSHSINSAFGPVSDGSTNQRSVGGSSGGSAIAVAKNLSHFALGTDTGGSVRLPAAYTGVVGFKPSYGLISRWGVVPYANSLDTVGILASTAKDLPVILKALRKHDPQDPTSLPDSTWHQIRNEQKASRQRPGLGEKRFANVTIGVPVEYNIEELHPSVRQSWTQALSELQELGCKVVPVSLPNTKHALSAYYVLAPAEAASNLSKYDGVRYGTRDSARDGAGDVLYSDTRGKGFGDEVKRRILLGSYTLSASAIDNYFLKAQKVRRLVQRDFDRVFKTPNPLRPEEQFDMADLHESIPLESKLGPTQVDYIVCPTAPTLPPKLGTVVQQSVVDSYMNDVFTVPASLAGLPAISIPCSVAPKYQKHGRHEYAGIQIIGQYGSDFKVLNLSRYLEQRLHAFDDLSNVKVPIRKIYPGEYDKGGDERMMTFAHEELQEQGQKIPENVRENLPRANLVRWHYAKAPLRGSPSKSEKSERQFQRPRKHYTKKGNYERASLTEKEADRLLESAFDVWGSNDRSK